MLVVRDALLGITRFSDFRTSLGISPDTLSNRLGTLVDFGVLERRSYRDAGSRDREEYVLTDAGRDLVPVLAALGEWGRAHRPDEVGTLLRYIDRATGEPVALGFTTTTGRATEATSVEVLRDTGAAVVDAPGDHPIPLTLVPKDPT